MNSTDTPTAEPMITDNDGDTIKIAYPQECIRIPRMNDCGQEIMHLIKS